MWMRIGCYRYSPAQPTGAIAPAAFSEGVQVAGYCAAVESSRAAGAHRVFGVRVVKPAETRRPSANSRARRTWRARFNPRGPSARDVGSVAARARWAEFHARESSPALSSSSPAGRDELPHQAAELAEPPARVQLAGCSSRSGLGASTSPGRDGSLYGLLSAAFGFRGPGPFSEWLKIISQSV